VDDEILNETEAARLVGITRSHLRKLRLAGAAPKHWHVGPRQLRYLKADVLAWRTAGGASLGQVGT
jgi:predicted DNA-binding transcriptional regulator AlpA